MKSSLKVHKLKIELLRNKSHRFNVNNIVKKLLLFLDV